MAANNTSIPHFLFDALKYYTEKFRMISFENPYAFEMNGVLHSVHASEIHDSGDGRPNPDEWRIQLQGTVKKCQQARLEEGYKVNFIGFFPNGKVFSAWEGERVSALSINGTGSVYIPYSDQAGVEENGAALRTVSATKIGRKSPEISMPISALGLYLENSSVFDLARETDDVLRIMNSVSSVAFGDQKVGSRESEVEIDGERKKVKTTRFAYPRDPKFRDKIMAAYGGSCCICGKQLGLVEAAHIVPHGHEGSSEAVTNGLALCAEHHRMYDGALLLLGPQRLLILNEQRVEHLENIGQGAGLDEVRQQAGDKYKVPDDAGDHPDERFLERGVRIRLGTDA